MKVKLLGKMWRANYCRRSSSFSRRKSSSRYLQLHLVLLNMRMISLLPHPLPLLTVLRLLRNLQSKMMIIIVRIKVYMINAKASSTIRKCRKQQEKSSKMLMRSYHKKNMQVSNNETQLMMMWLHSRSAMRTRKTSETSMMIMIVIMIIMVKIRTKTHVEVMNKKNID